MLHQWWAYHVGFVECTMQPSTFFSTVHRLEQAAAASVGQIDLSSARRGPTAFELNPSA